MLGTSPTLLSAASAIASAVFRASATAWSIASARAGAGSPMENVGPLMVLAPAAFAAEMTSPSLAMSRALTRQKRLAVHAPSRRTLVHQQRFAAIRARHAACRRSYVGSVK